MADDIGPQLPPHLLKQRNSQRDGNDGENNEQTYTQIQESGQIGPLVPDHLLKDQRKRDDDNGTVAAPIGPDKDTVEAAAKDEYGPSLPPHLQEKHVDLRVGPALPPGWNSVKEDDSEDDEEELIGPKPGYQRDEDDVTQRRKEIEDRANAMRDKLTGMDAGTSKPQREVWMTELPPELGANIGLAARTFKKRTLNSTEADRSVWTDTPADREKKLREKLINKEKNDEVNMPSKRDSEMQERVDEHNRQHRAMSLMEMHQEDRKKKKGDGPIERRPFDRSQDLDHRKMDKKAASQFIRTSKSVNSRFESSKFGQKFL